MKKLFMSVERPKMIKSVLRHWAVALLGAGIAVSLALMAAPASACGECDRQCSDNLYLCEADAGADCDECMRECSSWPGDPYWCQGGCIASWQTAMQQCNATYAGCASSCPSSDPTCQPPPGGGGIRPPTRELMPLPIPEW